MQFFRRIGPIKAISFDLDDTLYSNRPIMVKAEAEMTAYFARQFPEFFNEHQAAKKAFWWPHRKAALAAQPELVHDVTALRLACYQNGLRTLGLTELHAKQASEQAMAFFYQQRSDFSLSPKIYTLLTDLAEQVPIVAITNGNVDYQRLGLTDYFTEVFTPGNGVRRKPATDLFRQALSLVNVPKQHLLHVGDCGVADILGALQAGCQTAWLGRYDVGKPLAVLPHIALSRVEQLRRLF